MVESTLALYTAYTGGKGFPMGKGGFYGDVVDGMIVKAQPITGVRGFPKGKGGVLLSFCLSFILSFCLSHPYLR